MARRMGWRVAAMLALAAAAGCGRIGFGLGSDQGADAPLLDDGGRAVDVNLALPWRAPVRIDLGLAAVDDPSMTADGLEMYVNTPSAEVFVSRRATTADPWPPATRVTSLAGSVYSPHLSADGLTLWAAVAPPSRIVVTTRSTRTDSWAPLQDVVEVADPAGDDAPFVGPDGLVMVFDSRRNGGADPTLFVSERASLPAAWGAPSLLSPRVAAVATFGGRPAISADRLTVYFQGDGVPGNDIWQMQRNSVAEAFADPVPAAAFNSTGNEEDPWVSADHRTALFISNRSGQFQLWQATR